MRSRASRETLRSRRTPPWRRSRRAPFYAVEIFCGDFGTFTGLRTNASAQVIDRRSGMPVPGLYAAGNDMATVMGSHSVGGGITIGPAMVFGYIAGCHLAAQPRLASATAEAGRPMNSHSS